MMESNSSLKQWLAAGLGIACLVILGVRVMNSRHSELFQKSGTSAPDFSFQERSGKSFSSDELKGKVWVVDFIFTTCAGTCPILSAQMKRLQDEWKDNPDFKLVSLTVDPKRDTAAALKKYAQSVSAGENQWFFLTGEKKDLYAVAREGFKATADADPQGKAGFDFIHTTRMFLVDGRGMIRGRYDGQEENDMKKLRQDVKFLMSTKKKS